MAKYAEERLFLSDDSYFADATSYRIDFDKNTELSGHFKTHGQFFRFDYHFYVESDYVLARWNEVIDPDDDEYGTRNVYELKNQLIMMRRLADQMLKFADTLDATINLQLLNDED